MDFVIKIIDANPAENTIVCLAGDVEVWRSITPASLDPACTLNIDYPTIVDERKATDADELRYRVPTVAEAKVLRIDEERHRVAATYAAVVEAVALKDAAAAVQLPEAELVAEAEAWAVAKATVEAAQRKH